MAKSRNIDKAAPVGAVCYTRVSTEEQAREGVSLDAQAERLKAYCQLTGLEIIKFIREEGVSAAKSLNARPGGAEVIELISTKQIGHIVALKLDRLFRDAEDALRQTRSWDRAGIALHLVDMGGQTLNTASAMGRFFLSMAAAFAELERNLTSERTIAALGHKKNHLQPYGTTPFGFVRVNNRLIEDSHELAVIDQIRSWRGDGWSLRRIAAELSKLGVPTKEGGQWFASTVRYLLQNDLYKKRI
ncbi:MAG: recombinase family protein [Acidobacteriota bacterium]